VLRRLGYFGKHMQVALVLKLESGIQIKENLMERLDLADMSVRRKVTEKKTKEII
jgi:hypothetical protein